MAQQLGAQANLPEDPGSVSKTHIGSQLSAMHIPGDSTPSYGLHERQAHT